MTSRSGSDRMQFRLIVVFLILALFIGLAGYVYFDLQKQQIKKDIQDELSAIADLKVNQIMAWRKERLEDAMGIVKNPLIANAVQLFLLNPGTAGPERDILSWMKSLQDISNYQSVLLVDSRGRVRLSTSPDDKAIGPHAKQLVQEALRSGQSILSDFHKAPVAPHPHLDLVAPLSIQKGKESSSIGALFFRINPETFLYPLIQSWPGSSKSAETLLIRKDGDSVLFLNELRHRKDTALSLRIRLDRKRLPAAMAIQGVTGVFEGIDYREVPVLASTRSIPQTPWFLVAKVDIEEIYTSIRAQGRLMALVAVLLIAATGLIISFWWRQKSAENYRRQYQAEIDHSLLTQQYDYLSKYANDIILLIDPGGKILEANDRAVTAYGYSRDELMRLTIRDLRAPETLHEVDAHIQQVREQQGFVFETVHKRRNGSTFPVEVSSRVIDDGSKIFFQSIIRDITERKQAERSLKERNAFIETILDNLPIGLAVNNIKNGKAIYVNSAFEAIYGWPKDLLMDVEQFFACVYPDPAYRKEIKDRILSDIATGDSSRMRWENIEITTMTGKKKLVTAFNIPIFNQDMMISTVQDVTARKQSEKRLSMLNECLLSFGPDPDVNINRLVALCGAQLDAACALYNRLEGDTLYALGQWNTPPDFETRVKPDGHICFDVIKKGGQDVCVIRDLPATPYEQTDPNVVRYGLKTYIGKAVSFGGVFVGSLCVVYQIDPLLAGDELKFLEIVASAVGVEENRKGMIRALLESENRYKHLVETVTDYIYTVDVEQGRAIASYHGPGCVTVTGYTSQEYQTDPNLWYRMIFDGDRNTVIEQTKNILSGATIAPFEHRIIHKDGSIRWVKNAPVPRYDGKGRLIAYDGLITDITQLKMLENQLRQAQKMEAVGQLSGGIAHDFNNILTAIIGYAHLLLMKMPEHEAGRAYVEHILTASERAAHLTNSLLAFSRQQVIALKQVNLNDIIKRVENILGRVIGEDIEFKTKLIAQDLFVLADSIQIEQILMNLATNARDAMPDGGILQIETKPIELNEDFIRTHSYAKPGKYACMSVTDTGTGMDEKTSDRIFEPFFTTKEVGKGTGLGLSMVYGIIKQFNGYILVYSEPDKGTTFRIYLPLLTTPPREEHPKKTVVADRGIETVLLAEDDAAVRTLSRNVLEGFGYTVIEAIDGSDAVRKFIDNKDAIDLLVLDIIMPRKNGKEAYLEIKNIRPDIKTLFTSGYTADIIHKKGILDTGLDFILKPIAPMDLLKKVREVLDRG